MASCPPKTIESAFLKTIERTVHDKGVLHIENWLKLHPELIHTTHVATGDNVLCFARTAKVAALLLSKKNFLINEENSYGRLPIHVLSREGRLEVVEFILKKHSHMIHKQALCGATPLLCACEGGQLLVIQRIYKISSCTIEESDDDGENAMHYACSCTMGDPIPLIDWIHNLRPELQNHVDRYGNLPMHKCCRNGHLQLAQHLYRINPQAVYARTYDESTVMTEAAFEGWSHVVEWLLQICPELVNEQDNLGHTPLLSACIGSPSMPLPADYDSVVVLLYDHQADTIDFVNDFATALHHVCHGPASDGTGQENSVAVARAILRIRPEFYNARDGNGDTPLTLARRGNNTKLIDFLCNWCPNELDSVSEDDSNP